MQPEIIAHRGWDGKNSLNGILEALERGYGAEFDVRDVGDEAMITHDPFGYAGRHAMGEFDELLWRLGKAGVLNKHALAINVKSAGLAPRLKRIIDGRGLENYFCFDMASPDAAEYKENGLVFLDRASPLESSQCNGATGAILDCRHKGEQFYRIGLMATDKIRFIVCPTMHGLPELDLSPENWTVSPTHILRRFYK